MSIAATLFFWMAAYVTAALSPPAGAQAVVCANGPVQDADGVTWIPDCELGAGFVQTTMKFQDDYDGKVTSTVVRNEPLVPNARGAVLVIHGFLDYVFHAHVAKRLNQEGYDFYGLDLRKYGRSMDGAEQPNFCKSMAEYYADITAALDIMTRRHARVIVYAHSTGALPATLYARDIDRGRRIERIILNSPFLDFKELEFMTGGAAVVGRGLPFIPWKNPVSKWYARSLHKEYEGEWSFNRDWKPIDGAVAYLGWVNCVAQAHARVKKGLNLSQPILVLHSDKSAKDGPTWKEEYRRADLILDVEDIRQLSGNLGPRV